MSLQEVPAGLDQLLDGSGLSATRQDDVLGYPVPFAGRYGGSAVATRWPHRIVEVLDQRGGRRAPDVPWCTLAATVDVPELGPLHAQYSAAQQR